MVYRLALEDSRIVFIGSDLGPGTLDEFKRDMPERFFMEGISEGNVIGLAAGLAMEGFIPYVNTIASFLTRRCFEQVALDLCLHGLPVRLIGNGGGLVYAPLGPTHLAFEDIAIFRSLPGMSIVAPCDADEMRRLMPLSVDSPGPLYIRLGKGGDRIISREENGFEIGRAIQIKKPGEIIIMTTGIMTTRALEAASMLEGKGIGVGVLHVPTVKPLDQEQIVFQAGQVGTVVTLEEHVLGGGFGSAVGEVLLDRMEEVPRVLRLGIPDRFPDRYGCQNDLLEYFGLQPLQIANSIEQFLTTGRQEQ